MRIAFGVAGPVPLRALNAEAFINGREVTLENIQQFGRTVLEDIHPPGFLAGQQGLPLPHRRGKRQALPHRVRKAGRR